MSTQLTTKPGESQNLHLTREDWIDAAWIALSEGSLDTVKVDPIARRLKVTRGSFYWHFKNRQDLIDAVVDRWLYRLGRTTAVHHLIDSEKPPADRLWDVFEYVVRMVSGPQSVFFRVAAASDPQLLQRIQREDEDRIQAYAQIFSAMGLDEVRAQRMAKLYFVIVMSEFLRNGCLDLERRLADARVQHEFVTETARLFLDHPRGAVLSAG